MSTSAMLSSGLSMEVFNDFQSPTLKKSPKLNMPLYLNSEQPFKEDDYDENSDDDDDNFHIYSTCEIGHNSTSSIFAESISSRTSGNKTNSIKSHDETSVLLRCEAFNWADDVEEEEEAASAASCENSVNPRLDGRAISCDKEGEAGEDTIVREQETACARYQNEVEEIDDALCYISMADDDELSMIHLGLKGSMNKLKRSLWHHFDPKLQGYGPLVHLFETKLSFVQLSQEYTCSLNMQLCPVPYPASQCDWQLVRWVGALSLEDLDLTATIPFLLVTDDNGDNFTLEEKIERHSGAEIQEISMRRSQHQSQLQRRLDRWDLNGGVLSIGGSYVEQSCALAARDWWRQEQRNADLKWLEEQVALFERLGKESERRQTLIARAKVVPRDRLLAVTSMQKGSWHMHSWGVCTSAGCALDVEDNSDDGSYSTDSSDLSDSDSSSDSDGDDGSWTGGEKDVGWKTHFTALKEERQKAAAPSLPNCKTASLRRFKSNRSIYGNCIRPPRFDMKLSTIIEDWEMEEACEDGAPHPLES